jgi:thiamine-monophosphate kinase
VKFSDLGEFGFINRIARRHSGRLPCILKGIGDDAAVISFSDDVVILLTADQLIEGFHFRIDESGGKELGAKALAVNLSDIAAMGGEPIGYTVSLGIPTKRVAVDFLDAFYEGITGFGKTWGWSLSAATLRKAESGFLFPWHCWGKHQKSSCLPKRRQGRRPFVCDRLAWRFRPCLKVSEQGGALRARKIFWRGIFCPSPA